MVRPVTSGEKLAARIAARQSEAFPHCAVPGCGRPTSLAAGKGLGDTLCRFHIDQRARHGSTWRGSYPATELRPYLQTALRFLQDRRRDPRVDVVTAALQGLLDGAGRAEAAMHIKRRPARDRARIAFARLREAGVTGERLLANHMAMNALIADDVGSHRVREFRIVQVAKALHRLASGTHKRWDFPLSDGTTAPIAMHVYPKSSGLVLRAMGEEIEALCGELTAKNLAAIRALKAERYGPHPSRLPGWKPLWKRQREAALER